MNRCAFLTTDNLDGFVHDDELAVGPLRELGWTVEFVPWRSPVPDWDSFHVVVIRTPWDYPDDRQAFLEVLETVDRSAARLENSIDLVRWNLDKRYLLDLAASGDRLCQHRFSANSMTTLPINCFMTLGRLKSSSNP